VSDRPDRVERGGRATSTSQPPSHPEPEPGRPVRSNGPERSALTSPGPRVRRPDPGPEGPALRVVLVSRDKMLAGALRSLIDAPGGVRMLDWNSDELDSAIRHADVVIVDMPPTLHQRTFDVIDGRFLGRTVVLLQEGERAEAVPAGSSRSILYRPLQIGELWSAVTGMKGGPVAGERAASEVEQGDGEMENQVGEPETEAAEALEAGGPAPAGPEAPPGAEIEPEPDPSPEPEVQPGPEAAASDQPPVDAAAGVDAEAQGLPVAESGRLIGLSGQELDPVVGPGQVAPGMDEATFERLRGWKTGPVARQPAGTRKGPAPGRRRSEPESGAARRAREADAEARREQARRGKEARARDRNAARAEAGRQRTARADARTAAREESLQAKAAKDEARRIAGEERQARAEEARQAKAQAGEAARAQAAPERAAQAEARKVARDQARRENAARAEERRAAPAAKAEERRAARAAKAEQRQAARAAKALAKAAEAEARQAARAEAKQKRAAQAEANKAARAEAARERAARAEAEEAARREAQQIRAAEAEERQAARAAEAERREAAKAETARKRAVEAEAREQQVKQVKAAKAEARASARAEADQAKAARAEARKAERAAAAQAKAAQAEAGNAQRAAAAQAKAAKAEARQEAARQRAVQAEERRAAKAEARRIRVAGAGVAGAAAVGAPAHLADRLALPALVVVLQAVLATATAGLVGSGGPDTRAGEVAVARAAGSGGGLVAQDPRVGPIEPLPALGVGVWLRVTEAGGSLEAVIREARVPNRFLLAGVAGLTAVLFLLLTRVGPGSGAAAGPGPAPPQRPERRWRLGGAALAGALVALDPLLVRSGRSATGTVLAVLLAVGTVALAWGVPARPGLRWLPLVAACGGLALLVSPLALAVVAVPVVAELLQGRYQEASKDMAALGLAIGLWLLLPVWVAGQDLDAEQAGWLLGRPSGRGPVAESVAAAPLTWLLVAAGLAAAVLTWRHRSGAGSDGGPEAARLLAWTATSAAGALGAIALGYPAEQAMPFAVPAAAVSLAVGAVTLAAAGGTGQARRVALAGAGVVLVGLLAAQAVDWAGRYGKPADDGLGRLVATVGADVPSCSAVNAGGPADRARLLAAGVTVTDFSDGPTALAAGVRYFVLTGGTRHPVAPSLSAWVRQHGTMLAAHSSRSLHGVELWRVDAAPLDPRADLLPLPDGIFSNTTGSACGGYRVVDSQVGTFHTAYRSVGGKSVLGRPLGSVWTSDGPALQAFDTMVLGAVPTASGPPAVRPIELPPLLAKLDVEAVADADIPLPSVRPPVTNREVRALLREGLIGRAYLGTDPATATDEDFRRARDRFGRPLGLPQMMPDGAMRQPFERAVLELPADGGPVRPAALGRLAVQLGLVPRQAMRPEPVPGLPAREAETRLDPAPLLRLVGGALGLLLLVAGAGAVVAWRSGAGRGG
jgi:hypothetical protein